MDQWMFKSHFCSLLLLLALLVGIQSAEALTTSEVRGAVTKDYKIRLGRPVGHQNRFRAGYSESYQVFLPRVPVGASNVFRIRLGSHPQSTVHTINSITFNGDPELSMVADTCTGASIPAAAECYIDVQYAPKVVGGATATFASTWYAEFTDGSNLNGDTKAYLAVSTFDRPVTRSDQEVKSSLGVLNQALELEVPIVGTGISLHYTNEFAPEYKTTNAHFRSLHSFNREAWTNSIHHLYIPSQLRLYLGTGHVEQRLSKTLSNGQLVVVSSSGDEVYYFNANGRHLRTRSALTGAVKYTFIYDANGSLVRITDAFENSTTFVRNANGRIVSITAPRGQVTKISRNDAGLVSMITNPSGESFSMTYKEGSGLLETFKRPGGQISSFAYDKDGKLVKDLGFGGNFWRLSGDGIGNVTRISQMGRQENYSLTYGEGSYTINQISPSGLSQIHKEFSNGDTDTNSPVEGTHKNLIIDERFGNLFQRTNSSEVRRNSVSSWTAFGQEVVYGSAVTPDFFNFATLKKTQSVNGRKWSEVYKRSNKTKTITSPEGATTARVFDVFEKPVSFKVGNDTPVTYSYDGFGRLSGSIQGSQKQKTYSYNSGGFLQSITNARNEVTSYGYDLAGRVVSVTLPDSRMIRYSYDSNGNIKSVTPPNRPAHIFELNAFELPGSYQPPKLLGVANVTTEYDYNLDKQLVQIKRPSGESVKYNYNSNTGLLSGVTMSEGSSTISYLLNTDLISNIDSIDGIRSGFAYYGHRLQSEEQRRVSDDFLIGKIIYGFDGEHRQISRTLQGNSSSSASVTSMVLNKDNKPTQVGSMTLSYSYPSDRLYATVVSRISDSRSYDSNGDLVGYAAYFTPISGSPGLLYGYTLTRDIAGRISAKTETVLGVTNAYTYSYDTAGRLLTVHKDGAPYSSYVYDDNGNRIAGMTAGVNFTATYDSQDRMLSYGSSTFTYNANGDRIGAVHSGGLTNSYSYDALGNLKELVTTGGAQVVFGYDGKNRNVVTSVNGIIQSRQIFEDDLRMVGQVSDAGVIEREYVFAAGNVTPDYLVREGAQYRIISDHLGSPRLVVKVDDGSLAQRIDYNDLGGIINDTAPGFQNYGFAGGIYVGSGNLTNLGRRYYDAFTGRWVTKDPVLFKGLETNLYGYVLGDPVNSPEVIVK